MKIKNNSKNVVVFTGGGTGGHIYPGLAVADCLRMIIKKNDKKMKICWIGSSNGMDQNIVEKSLSVNGTPIIDRFYSIPSGKFRRYFSFRNLIDIFKVFSGCIVSFFLILKLKPVLVFSKGGFVSVPPCFAAHILKIPVYTHECDFTPGLATFINSYSASKIFISYSETKNYLLKYKKKLVLTGNPVRPVFYTADRSKGLAFLKLKESDNKPVLLIQGGSLGASQINTLILDSLCELCKDYIVVHQTGQKKAGCVENNKIQHYSDSGEYKSYPFIYKEMPDVMAAADVVISRAGANSLWECSTLGKPLILIPLCGSGTRGDQVENAEYFEKQGAAIVLSGEKLNKQELIASLKKMKNSDIRLNYSRKIKNMSEGKKPAEKIASLLYTGSIKENI